MTRAAQNLLLILLGAAILEPASVAGAAWNCVVPGSPYRWWPAARRGSCSALGAAGAGAAVSNTGGDDHEPHDHGHGGHGHDHSRGPRVAWLRPPRAGDLA